MKLKIPPGKYVLAVSGGVDSMSLLDILARQADLNLIVAHFNHGIRRGAEADEQLVRKIASQKGLTTETGYGKLGPNTSEAEARDARYGFLNQIKQQHQAVAIITAHHQDDLIETALLNLLRGTNRRGLSAISDSEIIRPLLGVPKTQILAYAKRNKLQWLEDNTNNDNRYLRNYLRLNILGDLSNQDRKKLVNNIEKASVINNSLNQQIATLSYSIKRNGAINRSKFIALPPEIADEVMADWLRGYGIRDLDKKLIQRLSMALKTGQADSEQPVKASLKLKIGQKSAHFTTTG